MVALIITILIIVPLVVAIFVIRAQTRSKLEKGLKLIEDGDFERAIGIFNELSKKNSSNRSHNWYRGLCYEGLGNFEMALVEFNNAAFSTTFRPPLNEVDIHKKIARININLGNGKKAESEFLLITTLDSAGQEDRAEANYYLGIISRNRDELQKGVEYFTQAIQLRPKFPLAYLELGKLNFQLTRFDAARKALMKAVSEDPDLVEANYYYGILLERDRSFKKGIEEFDIAMQDERYKFSSYFHLGLIHMELFDRELSFDFFEKALKLGTPDQEELLDLKYRYANFLVDEGNINRAIELWNQIQSVQHGYKDTESKLRIYTEVSRSASLSRFITTPKQEFLETGRALCRLLHIHIEDYRFGEENFIEFKGILSAGGIERMCIVHIARWTNQVGEIPVRELLERMNEVNATRGIFITSSKYSEKAMELSNIRPIELIARERLEMLLTKVYG